MMLSLGRGGRETVDRRRETVGPLDVGWLADTELEGGGVRRAEIGGSVEGDTYPPAMMCLDALPETGERCLDALV